MTEIAAPETRGVLAIVEVTRHLPRDADYHAYVEILNARTAEAARVAGWTVGRHAAADLGPEALLAATADADVLVIVGGEDLSPATYGGPASYPGQSQHFTAADEGQLAIVRRAIALATPLLGICRGLQVINVALGGTLIQDLGADSGHRRDGVPIRQIMHSHAVEIAPSSRLAAALGSTARVQSAHHQAIGDPGSGLTIAAVAPDGTIEAVEHERLPISGIQWHPEDPGAPAGQLESILEAALMRSTVLT
jgi:putative glutamine amidotransferase